jgi:hypothetical protein
MKNMVRVWLVTFLLAACGGGGDDPASNPVVPAAIAPAATIVVDKAALFLPGAGQSAQLVAQRFDAQGAPTQAAITWVSSAPDKVSVDANGRVTAIAIGSTQVFAQADGRRSAPTLVTVATPKPGALLLPDAQVLSVGPPLGLAAGAAPGVGSEYEVTLQGVTAPAPGTLVLAAETAPVAGKVVSSRQDAAGLVVRLAIVPLYELLDDYDLRFDIDLSGFAMEAVPERATTAAAGPVWTQRPGGRARALASARPLDVFEPFKAWKCDASIKPQLVDAPIQLSLENKLRLVLEDRPGYSKHALEGSAAIVGSAGLKLKAGFKASGRCDAQGQLKLAAFGWVSLLVMPGVRFGLGAEVEGEILLVQGELGVEGKVGFAPVLGWECGGATPACSALDTIDLINEFKTKSKIPSANDMQAKVSAQFYVVTGLDAVIALGAANAGLVEARIGPKQSFDLAFEPDQAARSDHASSYDLKLEGVVEPGEALKKAIEKVIDDKNTALKFKAEFTTDISESPKGSLSLDKARIRPGEKVDFTVELDPKTVSYFLLDYNVTGVQLYRKREDETEFTDWKAMSLIASNRATYSWTPTEADAGKYEFAAFVDTQKIPVPLLEIAPDSIRPLEVACFSAAPSAAAPKTPQGTRALPQATACFDTWVGTATLVAKTPGLPTANIASRSTITWTLDPTQSSAGATYYTASGSFDLAFNNPDACVTVLTPNTFVIVKDPTTPSRLGFVDNGFTPPSYGFGGSQLVDFTTTVSCPGKEAVVTDVHGFLAQFAYGTGPFTTGQTRISGSSDDGAIATTWDFSRP